jgi:hypothetical protein
VNLTGQSFIGLLAAAATVLCVGVVLLWPRLARDGIRPVLGRIGLQLAAQLTVLATVAAAANAYFGFYTSWNDLLGIGPRSYVITEHTNGRLAPAALVTTHATTVVTAGGVDVTVTVNGQLTGISATATVYLPSPRASAAHARRRAILVLTNDPAAGTPAWLAKADSATAPAVLVVMRSATGSGAPCVDVPSGAQAATFLAVDVPYAIGSTYGIAAGPGDWAVAGDGPGGYCALKLAMTHSDVFAASAAVNGYYQPGGGPPAAAYGGSPAIRDETDLLWRIHNLPAPPVTALLGAAGSTDARAFVAAVRSPMTAVVLSPHDGRNLVSVLPLLATRLASGGGPR